MTPYFIQGLLMKIFLVHCFNFSSSKHLPWHTRMEIKKSIIRSSSFKPTLENLLSSPEIDPEKLNYAASKSGLSRKLSLKTKFLLVSMKLWLSLLQTDLAYRVEVSPGSITNIHYLDKTTSKRTRCAYYLTFKITSKTVCRNVEKCFSYLITSKIFRILYKFNAFLFQI